MSQLVVMVVMVVVVRCIKKEQTRCWFHSWTRTLKTKKSLYVIAGPLQVPPTQLLTTCLLATALMEMYVILS